MKSALPKVLHRVAGKTLLDYSLDLAKTLRAQRTVVVAGHGLDRVEEHLATHWKRFKGLKVVEQRPQLGTGHAVQVGLTGLKRHSGPIVVLYADVPLLTAATVKRMISRSRRRNAPISFLTMVLDDGGSYGRVVRDAHERPERIVEAADATEEELSINEVNAGIYCFDGAFLRGAARTLARDNAQGEFYLTDTIEYAGSKGLPVTALECDPIECQGVNDRVDLAICEASMQWRLAEDLMRAGVTLTRPGSVTLESGVRVGRDTVIGWGVHILGETRIGQRCRIDAGAVLKDANIESDVWVKPYSVITESTVRRHAQIGPFSQVRMGSRIGPHAMIGNFVEAKKAVLHRGVRALHLTYLGDCEIGRDTNVGAGTITCNYDGVRKQKTEIGARVHIGSDTQFVAPVTVGNDAVVGAGTTVLSDVPRRTLVVNPKTQRHIKRKAAAGKRVKKRKVAARKRARKRKTASRRKR
jgi:bifunctional UDP-N-acetylglucosamine pyrophosphorylase/glucosamine-1-phosphate N-acetyltransferase